MKRMNTFSVENMGFTGVYQSYFSEVGQYKMLTDDEEVRLSAVILAGGKDAIDARNKLVEANLPFVIKEAMKFSTSEEIFADLIQAGNYGLVAAAERYDAAKCKGRFVSYARCYVQKYMREFLNQDSSMLYVPEHAKKDLGKFMKEQKKQLQAGNTDYNIADYCTDNSLDSKSQVQLMQSYEARLGVYSLDWTFEENGKTTLVDCIPSDCGAEGAELLSELLDEAMDCLDARESFILKHRFGINCEEMSIQEIGKALSLSRERVRQLYQQALDKIRTCRYSNSLRYCMAA